MIVLYVLIPLALLLAGLAIYGFTWAVRSGQYEDTKTPAYRLLWDDENTLNVPNTPKNTVSK